MISLKNTKVFILVLAWLMASSHCIAADLLSGYFSSNTKVVDHCGSHHESNNKSPSSDHHSSCKDNGCCQPLIKTFELTGSELVGASISLALLPVSIYTHDYAPVIETRGVRLPFAHAPPGYRSACLPSLDSAPNAPPFFS